MLTLSSDDHSELRTDYPGDRAVDLSDPAMRSTLSPAAIRGFFNIAREWGLDESQMRSLLGGIASSTLPAWKREPDIRVLDHGSQSCRKRPGR
jgi:hypothetical protein